MQLESEKASRSYSNLNKAIGRARDSPTWFKERDRDAADLVPEEERQGLKGGIKSLVKGVLRREKELLIGKKAFIGGWKSR